MKKNSWIFMIVLAMMFFGTAYADKITQSNDNNVLKGDIDVIQSNDNNVLKGDIKNVAEGGDATSSSGASAGAGAEAYVEGLSAINEGDTITVEGDNWEIPANSAYAPHGFSNMTCAEVFGLGYTNKNGSGSLGLPIPRWLSGKLKDCEAEKDSIWLAELGLVRAAIEARCATRSMRARFGGKGTKKQQTEQCVTELTEPYDHKRERDRLTGLIDELGHQNSQLVEENQQLRNEVGTCRLEEACGK